MLCFERKLSAIWTSVAEAQHGARAMEHRVQPSSIKFVGPSAEKADLVADGSGALDWEVERVLAEMRKRGLLTERGEGRGNGISGLPDCEATG